MERGQFTFFSSFYKAICRIRKKSSRADAYDAICGYALDGIEPDLEALDDAAAIAFELIRPNLDASKRKASSGSRGGVVSKTEANRKQTQSKVQARCKQTASEKEKEGETEKEIEIENECLKGDAGEKSDFDIFWEAYPRKVGKKEARKAFSEVTVSLDVLLAALKEHKCSAQWRRDGGQYIPNPATWLSQGRWEDTLPADTSGSVQPSGQLGQAELEAIARVLREGEEM